MHVLYAQYSAKRLAQSFLLTSHDCYKEGRGKINLQVRYLNLNRRLAVAARAAATVQNHRFHFKAAERTSIKWAGLRFNFRTRDATRKPNIQRAEKYSYKISKKSGTMRQRDSE